MPARSAHQEAVSFREIEMMRFADANREQNPNGPCQNVCGLRTALDSGEIDRIFAGVISTVQSLLKDPKHVLLAKHARDLKMVLGESLRRLSSEELFQQMCAMEISKIENLLGNDETSVIVNGKSLDLSQLKDESGNPSLADFEMDEAITIREMMTAGPQFASKENIRDTAEDKKSSTDTLSETCVNEILEIKEGRASTHDTLVSALEDETVHDGSISKIVYEEMKKRAEEGKDI